MSGAWVIDTGLLNGASFQLTQSGAIVSGTFSLPKVGAGSTDPAEPGQITMAGNLRMRVKVGRFTDFRMEGNMDSTGTRVTGNLQGSGFTGQPFSMHK